MFSVKKIPLAILDVAREEISRQRCISKECHWKKELHEYFKGSDGFSQLHLDNMVAGLDFVYYCLEKVCRRRYIRNPLRVKLTQWDVIEEWRAMRPLLQVTCPNPGDLFLRYYNGHLHTGLVEWVADDNIYTIGTVNNIIEFSEGKLKNFELFFQVM